MTTIQEVELLRLRLRFIACGRKPKAEFTSNRGGVRQAPVAAVSNPPGYRTAMADFGS